MNFKFVLAFICLTLISFSNCRMFNSLKKTHEVLNLSEDIVGLPQAETNDEKKINVSLSENKELKQTDAIVSDGKNETFENKSHFKKPTKYKILYNVGSFNKGKMKDHLCDIIGIINKSDIKTIMIVAVTRSNNPPKLLPNSSNQSSLSNQINSRSNVLNDYVYDENNEDDDFEFQRISGNDNIKLRINPNLIEGPPPLEPVVNQNNPLIVEPQEFESDESNSAASDEQRNEEGKQDDDNEMNTIQVADAAPETVQSDETTTTTRVLSASTTVASTISTQPTENLIESSPSSVPLTVSSPNSIIPPTRFMNNIKKVNQYLINRAQDALDMIRHPNEKTATVGQSPTNRKMPSDGHSDLTRNIIDDFKKMPQFVLRRVKDGLSEIKEKVKNPIETSKENNIGLTSRVAEENEMSSSIEEEAKVGATDVAASVEIESEEVAKSPITTTTTQKQPLLKSKLEKYLAEQKEKRQQMYPLKINEITTTIPDVLGTKKLLNDENTVTLTDTSLLGKPKLNLREKLRNFLDDSKLKANKPLMLDKIKLVPATPSLLDNDNLNIDIFPKLKSRLSSPMANEVQTDLNQLTAKLNPKPLLTVSESNPKPSLPLININQNIEPLLIDQNTKSVLQNSQNALKNNLEDANARRELLKSKLDNYIARLKSSRTTTSPDNMLLGEPLPSTTQSTEIGRKVDEETEENLPESSNFMANRLGMDNDATAVEARNNDETIIAEQSNCEDQSRRCKGKYHNIGSIVIDQLDTSKKFLLPGPPEGLPLKFDSDGDKIDLLIDLEQLCQCRVTGSDSGCSSSTCQKNKRKRKYVFTGLKEKGKGENREKSDVSKRSTELNENRIDLPQLTDWKNVVYDLTNFGKQIKRSFSDSVQQIGNGLEEIETKKLLKKNLIDKQNLINPPLLGDTLGKKIHKILNPNDYEINEINSKLLNKDIYSSLIPMPIDQSSFGINQPQSIFSKSKPSFLESKLNEINNNLERIPTNSQQVKALRKKLEELDNKVETFNKENEQMILNESRNLLGDKKNQSAANDNLIKNVFSWIKDVAAVAKDKK